MRTRSELTGGEVEVLYTDLNRRLDALGLESQPEVALRVLELVSDPGSGAKDFAAVLQNDPALTGRLLKTANSAYFAQRRPVTTVDRACVILGMERIRALSLGFSLARASTPGAFGDLARRVWGVSVYRGCLAAELSRATVGGAAQAAEAFVVGLMLDVGVPLMHRLLGSKYEAVLSAAPSPMRLYQGEFAALPFTHADVAAALCRRWGLPEVLRLPIEWRYVPPQPGRTADLMRRMQRVAHYAGAVHVRPWEEEPVEAQELASSVRDLLCLQDAALEDVLADAAREYGVAMTAFSGIAEAPGDAASITRCAHGALAELVAAEIARQLSQESTPAPERFMFDGLELEVRPLEDGDALAVLHSGSEAIVQHHFALGPGSAEQILAVLGVEPPETLELDRFRAYLAQLAA